MITIQYTARRCLGGLARATVLACALASAGVLAGTVTLDALTTGDFRWRDVHANVYATAYSSSYEYGDGTVTLTFSDIAPTFRGRLTAVGLKPNFAYQMKIVSEDPTWSGFESIGYSGRWWREHWDETIQPNGAWVTTQSDWDAFNNQPPNTSLNDDNYDAAKDVLDPSSPTGNEYKYTSYLMFDYFVTDENGDATVDFDMAASYHVLWREDQRTPTDKDGPSIVNEFMGGDTNPAYGAFMPWSLVRVFGEWEREFNGQPVLPNGVYQCKFFLTEESFHEMWSPYYYTDAGSWAHAMSKDIQFTIDSSMTVPTLSEWGMLALIGLLGGAAARRRARHATRS